MSRGDRTRPLHTLYADALCNKASVCHMTIFMVQQITMSDVITLFGVVRHGSVDINFISWISDSSDIVRKMSSLCGVCNDCKMCILVWYVHSDLDLIFMFN